MHCSNICLQGRKKGYFDTLLSAMYAVKSYLSTNKYDCWNAAYYGHLECLKYAAGIGSVLTRNRFKKYKGTCFFAAKNGHLDCLIYCVENGFPKDELTCLNAAVDGHLECLKYAVEKGFDKDKKTCYVAAYYGHLECLIYCVQNGFECSDNDFVKCISKYDTEFLGRVYEKREDLRQCVGRELKRRAVHEIVMCLRMCGLLEEVICKIIGLV